MDRRPPPWTYNPTTANSQNASASSSRPEPPIHPDRLQRIYQGTHGPRLPPPTRPPPGTYREVAHAPRLPRPSVEVPRYPRNRHPGSQRGTGSLQAKAALSLPTKSAYPSAHALHAPGFNNDPDERRSSRMSAMSARSSTRASSSGTPVRMAPQAGRFRLYKGQLVPLDGDSSDDDIDANAPVRRQQLAAKSLRKTVPESVDSQPGPSSAVVDREDAPPRVPLKAARKKQVIVISSDSEPEEDKAEAEFIAVASHIRLPMRLHAHKHLPFLCRNLRRSFLRTCSALGIAPRTPGKPQRPMEYVYRYKLTDFTGNIYNSSAPPSWTEYRELVTEWRCPFCDFLGELPCEEMLRFHLRQDHCDVASTEWTTTDGRIKVVMTLLPPPADEEPEVFSDDESDVQEPDIRLDSPPAEQEAGIQIKREPLFYPDDSPEPPASEATAEPTPTASAAPSSTAPSATPAPPPTTKLKPELDAEHQRPLFTPTAAAAAGTHQPRTGLSADGRLLPPPADDPHGPAAAAPAHACRPGGARVYDLLDALPRAPFGVLAWAVLDREEELYELVDVRDADKAVLALWNRWIFLNRTAFNFNGYRNGVEAFIDAYYEMIHRAAGWTALRSLLLVLAANRFLSLREVLRCLAHYEKRVADALAPPED